jgi:hypothetical protein
MKASDEIQLSNISLPDMSSFDVQGIDKRFSRDSSDPGLAAYGEQRSLE